MLDHVPLMIFYLALTHVIHKYHVLLFLGKTEGTDTWEAKIDLLIIKPANFTQLQTLLASETAWLGFLRFRFRKLWHLQSASWPALDPFSKTSQILQICKKL
jgi:hypothetical protein